MADDGIINFHSQDKVIYSTWNTFWTAQFLIGSTWTTIVCDRLRWQIIYAFHHYLCEVNCRDKTWRSLFTHLVMLLTHRLSFPFFHAIPKHQIRDEGIFQNSRKHKQEAHYQKPFQRFDVRDLWQGGPGTTNQRCHGEHSGDSHGNPCSRLFTIHPETDPGQHHDQIARQVNLKKNALWSLWNKLKFAKNDSFRIPISLSRQSGSVAFLKGIRKNVDTLFLVAVHLASPS